MAAPRSLAREPPRRRCAVASSHGDVILVRSAVMGEVCVERGRVFLWLQSIDRPRIGCFVVQARSVFPNCPEAQVRQAIAFCGIEDDEDVAVLAICRIPPEPEPPTVNLQAPIGVGLRSRRGAQVLLHASELTMAMPLG